MRLLVGFMMLTLGAAAVVSSAGCGSDGYTPDCADAKACLEDPKGGQWIVDAGSGDAAADSSTQD